MPVFVILVIIFAVWLRYEIKKSSRSYTVDKESFWEKETRANYSRKKDISALNYIHIPLDEFPFSDDPDEELSLLEVKIKELSKETILNLTGYSNTDLKLEYGASNIHLLSKYDYNFTLLARTLYQWGNYLYKSGKIKDARTILEFGITCNTDIKNHYMLLADIYKEAGEYHNIEKLITTAQNINSLLQNSIINTLKDYLPNDD